MLGGEVYVIFWVGEVWLFAPLADEGVCILVVADGAGLVGEVGDVEEEVALLCGGVFGEGIELGDFLVDGADFCLDVGGVFAFGFELADLLGGAFALCLKFLLCGFRGAAGVIAGEDFVDEFPVIAAASLETMFLRPLRFPE